MAKSFFVSKKKKLLSVLLMLSANQFSKILTGSLTRLDSEIRFPANQLRREKDCFRRIWQRISNIPSRFFPFARSARFGKWEESQHIILSAQTKLVVCRAPTNLSARRIVSLRFGPSTFWSSITSYCAAFRYEFC